MRRFGWLVGLGALIAGGAGAQALGACSVDFGSCVTYPHDGCPGYTSASTTTTTGTGGSTSSSSGSSGCTEASQCPAVSAGPCASLGTKTCTGGVCGVTYTPGPAPSQVYGNCHQNKCDATGKMTSVVDDTNVFVSGNACLTYACSSGELSPIFTQDSSCSLDGGTSTGFCEPDPDPTNAGLELCSQCEPSAASTCPGGTTCDHGTCKPSHCTDNTKDANETDVDCGGPDCLPCGTGKTCNDHNDCFGQLCSAGECVAPSCSDGFQNAAETDVDCGGGTCSPCAAGQVCLQPSDCESRVCTPSTASGTPDRCAAPTCTDGVQNGVETGVDCGGPDVDGGASCPPCAP